MNLLDVERSIVIIIDLQGKLMEMVHRPELVIKSTVRLLKLADIFQVPVIITEQYPRGLGKTHDEVWQCYESLTTLKCYMEKTSFGCCGDPKFETLLNEVRPNLKPGERHLVIAGIETHICIMQTVLALLEKREHVQLCWECISGRGEQYRKHALERMAQAGAIITNHESVGFEWARDKNHPNFKAMNTLFREGQIT